MKKLIFTLLFVCAGLTVSAQLDTVNTGTRANSRDGDPLRTAFSKINDAIIALNALITDFNDSIVLATVTRLKTDTVSIMVAGLGSLQTPDTAAFNNGAWAGAVQWNGPDSLNITAAISALGPGTGTETLGYNVFISDTLGAVVPTKLFTSDRTVTAVIPTVGDRYTTIANAKVAPLQWMWVPISGVSPGNRPGFFTLTVAGYLINGR